jgi:hypothetical protein
MSKNVTIFVLAGLLVSFGVALIHVENQRYALELEVCGVWTPEKAIQRLDCLKDVETRTSPIWHLFYGLGIL